MGPLREQNGGREKHLKAGQAKNPVLKLGDWNRIRLEAMGDTFTLWLNGEQITKYADKHYPNAGPIGLQIQAGLRMKVEFRNIQIKPLG